MYLFLYLRIVKFHRGGDQQKGGTGAWLDQEEKYQLPNE